MLFSDFLSFFSKFSVLCDFWCFLHVIFCDFCMGLFGDFKGGVRKKISDLPLAGLVKNSSNLPT